MNGYGQQPDESLADYGSRMTMQPGSTGGAGVQNGIVLILLFGVVWAYWRILKFAFRGVWQFAFVASLHGAAYLAYAHPEQTNAFWQWLGTIQLIG
jgi:hypothetical protein